MKYTMIVAALAAALSLSTGAVAEDKEPEGKKLAIQYFTAMDTNGDEHLSLSEYLDQKRSEFISMDFDGNRILSWEEFKGWSFGMEQIAKEKRRVAGYKVARRVLFDLMDRDNNWWLTELEQQNGFAMDHKMADQNNDGLLSAQEFLWNSMYSITLRSALGKAI